MKNYFNKSTIKTTLEKNKINGKSAERYFAAILTTAFEARVFWATRTEDDSQVDLISVISHPWLANRVEVLFTQVKSGDSYGKTENDKLIVIKSKFENLLNRNHNTLICWTKVDEKPLYWFLIKANSKYFRTEYSENHLVSPATRFDIVRILTSTVNKNGGKGLAFSRLNWKSEYNDNDFLKLRNKAKAVYTQLKSNEFINPLFGKVEFTRLGWRHITRQSRLNIYKVASYEIMPLLGNIITTAPSKHYILNTKEAEQNEYTYRETEYVLQYENIKCYDKDSKINISVNVYLKILEFVQYSKDWRSTANSSAIVNRRIIFKSVYFKIKKSS